MARVKFGKRLIAFTLFMVPSTQLFASTEISPATATSFAYRTSHPAVPLPESVIESIVDSESDASAVFELETPPAPTVEPSVGAPRIQSRSEVCGAVASVAKANDLPVPFFANLIWQESSFNSRTISRAGAQGIAQFMPRTAAKFGLINPFEPIHALNVAGKFLRDLRDQFGNLGLAAAAYNAGPGRVVAWMAKRAELPGETRQYVQRITGRPAEDWTSADAKSDPETTLMPAKAPCTEVAEAVRRQEKFVRIARLMSEIARAAAAPVTEAMEADAAPERGGDAVQMAGVSESTQFPYGLAEPETLVIEAAAVECENFDDACIAAASAAAQSMDEWAAFAPQPQPDGGNA
jgi:hypothetical protein